MIDPSRIHPLAAKLPPPSAHEYGLLRESIKAEGQRVPITTLDGLILDGRARLSACLDAGIDPVFEELDGSINPIRHVIGMNAGRRHLDKSVILDIILDCEEWRAPGSHGKAAEGMTNAEIAEAAETSVRTVKRKKAEKRRAKGVAPPPHGVKPKPVPVPAPVLKPVPVPVEASELPVKPSTPPEIGRFDEFMSRMDAAVSDEELKLELESNMDALSVLIAFHADVKELAGELGDERLQALVDSVKP